MAAAEAEDVLRASSVVGLNLLSSLASPEPSLFSGLSLATSAILCAFTCLYKSIWGFRGPSYTSLFRLVKTLCAASNMLSTISILSWLSFLCAILRVIFRLVD